MILNLTERQLHVTLQNPVVNYRSLQGLEFKCGQMKVLNPKMTEAEQQQHLVTECCG